MPQVANRAVGVIRNLVQVGSVVGDIHVHSRRPTMAVVIAVWLPFLIAVSFLLSGDSTRQSQPRPALEQQTPAPPTTTPAVEATPIPSSVPSVHQDETRMILVEVPGEAMTALDDLRIAVETAGFTNTYNGEVSCGGGGNGPGGGSCTAIGGGTQGTSTIGVIDFSVITPALTCRVSSVHVNESVVVVEPSQRWVRIVVLAIEPHNSNTQKLTVSFDVSRGHGDPAPQSPKVCVPG